MELRLFGMEYFLAVLVRMSGIFVFAPFFNGKDFPLRAKIGASFFLAFLVFSNRQWDGVLPTSEISYTLLLLRECLVGFVLGYLLSLLFAGAQAAGEIVGYQMGFSLVSSYDPDMGQLEIISQMLNMLALAIFLLLNGHQKLIEIMARSYDILPIGGALLTRATIFQIVSAVGQIFALAFKLGAPVVVALWMVSIFLALLNRMVPQMNIFMVDFPIKAAVGFIALALCLPFFGTQIKYQFGRFLVDAAATLRLMKG